MLPRSHKRDGFIISTGPFESTCPSMKVHGRSCPKGANAFQFLTNVFSHFPMDHKKMIHHFIVISGVDKAIGAHGLALIVLHVIQQMSSVRVAVRSECLETQATSDERGGQI